MRKILFFVVLVVAGCGEPVEMQAPGEWTFSKSNHLGNEHVVTVKGHGKTCYVFVEDLNARNAAVLLWCDND